MADLPLQVRTERHHCRVAGCWATPAKEYLNLCDKHWIQFNAEKDKKWGYPPERPFNNCWCCARTYKGNEPGHCEMCHDGKSHF